MASAAPPNLQVANGTTTAGIHATPVAVFGSVYHCENGASHKRHRTSTAGQAGVYPTSLSQDVVSILVMSSDPRDAGRLRLATERRELEHALQVTRFRENFQIHDIVSCRVHDITRALDMYKPTILHFSGHGNSTGLFFEKDDGKAIPVEKTKLAALLASQRNLNLVVLNACYSEEQADAMADAVGCVIGMEGAIQNDDATAFARELYRALGDGRSYEDAFERAKLALGLTSDALPHFLRRGGLEPSNVFQHVYFDHQIATAPHRSAFTVPFNQDLDFIDWNDTLGKINKRYAHPGGRVALAGLTGMGKSQFAIEYSYRVRKRSAKTAVFWIYAATQESIEEGFRTIAKTANIDGWDNPKADIFPLVLNWLRDESNGRWMMILDGADDSRVLSNLRERPQTQTNMANSSHDPTQTLSDFFPQSPNGFLFITTRDRRVAFQLTGGSKDIINVGPMDPSRAAALVRKKIRGGCECEVMRLVEALDYIPLAITQAVAYIDSLAPRMTISKFMEKLQKGDKDRAELLEMSSVDLRRYGNVPKSIVAALNITFDYLRKYKPSATSLLSLMSLFDRHDIPESLLVEQYPNPVDEASGFEADIRVLLDFSLVSTGITTTLFEMHQTVQLSVKRWLRSEVQELDEWKTKYMMLIDKSYPSGRYENWTVCHRLYPHALAVVECRPPHTDMLEVWASILFRVASYKDEMGDYQAAWDIGMKALEARKASLGANHLYTLVSIGDLAVVLQSQRRYSEAEAMGRQALAGKEKTLGVEHPNTLTSVLFLATILQDQEKYEEAEKLSWRAFEGRENQLGISHPDTLASRSVLATVLQDRGHFSELESLNRRPLAETDESNVDPLDKAASANIRASILQDQELYEEAENMCRQSIAAYQSAVGLCHPDALTSMHTLASIYEDQENYSNAEVFYKHAFLGRKKIFGPSHPDTLFSASNLVLMLHDQLKYAEAEALGRWVLRGYKEVFGPDHPHTLTFMRTVALLQCQRKAVEAEAMNQGLLRGIGRSLSQSISRQVQQLRRSVSSIRGT